MPVTNPFENVSESQTSSTVIEHSSPSNNIENTSGNKEEMVNAVAKEITESENMSSSSIVTTSPTQLNDCDNETVKKVDTKGENQNMMMESETLKEGEDVLIVIEISEPSDSQNTCKNKEAVNKVDEATMDSENMSLTTLTPVNIENTTSNKKATDIKNGENNKVTTDDTESNNSVISDGLKRPIESLSSSGYVTKMLKLDNSGVEPLRSKKLDIYVDDPGPKWYQVHGDLITPAFKASLLPDMFEYLPIHGRPNTRDDLEDFHNRKIKEFIGCDINDEEFNILKEYCSPEHLKTGKELVMPTLTPAPGMTDLDTKKFSEDASADLCVVKKLKIRLEKDPNNQYLNRLKYRGQRITPLTVEENLDTAPPEDLLEPGRDLVYRVRVYRPYSNVPGSLKHNPRRHSVFSRDIILLGRSNLCEMRDRFICPNDLDLRVDQSNNLCPQPEATAKDVFPSGFFFINNVFYVDNRAGCHDISAGIRSWAKSKAMGDFPCKDMESTKLEDLVLRLGHPEVYLHQGNCEHLFVFSEIRLLSSQDPLRASSYPCHTTLSINHTIYCTTCAEFGAKWIVTGCNRVPFDPAFFCETCLKLYLYKDGKKICDFKVYSYLDNEVNMIKSL